MLIPGPRISPGKRFSSSTIGFFHGHPDQQARKLWLIDVVNCQGPCGGPVIGTAQTDPVPQTDLRSNRRQRDHGLIIGLEPLNRAGADRAHPAPVCRVSHSANWALKSAGEVNIRSSRSHRSRLPDPTPAFWAPSPVQ